MALNGQMPFEEGHYFKSIVTAEAKMDVERKGIQSYQSDIYARFLCFGNGALTALYDHSDGFWRRQLVLTTKDRPANREDDPFLVEALSAELEGILLWCLDGLQRLLRNSYKFTVSPKAAANLETIKSNGAATMSLTFWIRRVTSATRQTSLSVPETSMKSTSCGVRTMPVTQYRRHGSAQKSVKTLSG